MLVRRITENLGRLSEHVTIGFIRLQSSALPKGSSSPLIRDHIRQAQVDTVVALIPALFAGYAVTAALMLAVDVTMVRPRAVTVVWAMSLFILIGFSALRLIRFKALQADHLTVERPDVATSGRIVLYSLVYASFWSLPLIYMLQDAPPEQAGFIAAVVTGVTAAGAIVFYTAPLAVLILTLIPALSGASALYLYDHLLWAHYGLAAVMFLSLIYLATGRHAILFLNDFLRRQDAFAERTAITRLLGDSLHDSGPFLWRCDDALLMRETSEGLLRLFGCPDDQIIGRPVMALFAHASFTPITAQDAKTFALLDGPADALPVRADFMLTVGTGAASRTVQIYVRKTLTENGVLVGIDGFARDITDEHAAQKRARFLADHDPMTGLLNTQSFRSRSAGKLAQFNAAGSKDLALMFFIDSDNLKSVNDTYGHFAGDRLICVLAERLRSFIGTTGLAARKGGDEFLVCLTNIAPSRVETVTSALHANLSRPFTYEGLTLEMSCSIGLAVAPAGEADSTVLTLNADRALYVAKSNGRGRIEQYSAELGAAMAFERRLSADLPEAIRRGDLRFEYQPVVNISTGEICACEALVRWDHPELGVVPATRLVEIARNINAVRAISDLVLATGLREAAAWPEKTRLCVNLVAHEMAEADCFDRIRHALELSSIPPTRLSVEITENEILEHSEQVMSNLTRLRALGVRILVDDFGAGYSSLSYLPKYPCDAIKIDRSLITNCATTDVGPPLLHAIAKLARVMGIDAVAEGVESPADLAIVRQAGLRMAQGFYFHRPMTSEALTALFAQPPHLPQPDTPPQAAIVAE